MTPWLDTFAKRAELLDALYLLHRETDPLAILRLSATLRELGAHLREQAVREARAAGATWEQIGEASKTSRQQEHRRYAHLEEDEPA